MNRNKLTTQYLDVVADHRLPANEIAEAAAAAADLTATGFLGRILSRPVFLTHDEQTELAADLENLHTALTSLPDRLFGGDQAAFARAVGMAEPQVAAIARSRSSQPTRLARADLYHDGTGFRVMEINMGSSAGGLDNPVLNRALLTHPVLADFVAGHQLTFTDTMRELAMTIMTECQIPAGERPLVAAVDWPASFPKFEKLLHYSAGLLGEVGIDAVACHLGQLSVRDGRVWLDQRPVDIIYRVFLIEDLLAPEGPELIDPILRAVERGEVAIFTPMDAELYDSKGALALLSDEANRHRFAPEVLTSLDRILPWTRMVRPGPVSVDGEQVELAEYARDQREELILKPTLMHGGNGVVPGWAIDADEWTRQLTAAMDGPYVLQRRIRPVPELFPTPDGLQPWILNWGAFLATGGYGGAFIRADADPAGGVVNMATGASGTCCFHETPTGDA